MQLLVFRARKTNMHVFYCRQVKSTFEDRFWKTKQKKYYNSPWPVLSILMPLAPRSCKCHFLFIAIHIMCLWRYCYISVLALFFSVSHTSISCSKQFCEKTKQKNYCFFFFLHLHWDLGVSRCALLYLSVVKWNIDRSTLTEVLFFSLLLSLLLFIILSTPSPAPSSRFAST